MPSESDFEPRSPKYGPVLAFGVLLHIAQILGLFGAFLGRFSDISWS